MAENNHQWQGGGNLELVMEWEQVMEQGHRVSGGLGRLIIGTGRPSGDMVRSGSGCNTVG